MQVKSFLLCLGLSVAQVSGSGLCSNLTLINQNVFCSKRNYQNDDKNIGVSEDGTVLLVAAEF